VVAVSFIVIGNEMGLVPHPPTAGLAIFVVHGICHLCFVSSEEIWLFT
jgi:hypothetical protein